MGGYLNPESDLFEMALRSQIFVDKSGLIEKTNRCVRTLQRYICVSRPRRFGKSMGVDMLAGEKARINTGTFSNDMTTFATKDDVLTLLGHLGYLTYDSVNETVRIPNKEVSQEYVNAISTMNWYGVAESVEDSRKLLESLWALDEEAVAAGIEKAHDEMH